MGLYLQVGRVKTGFLSVRWKSEVWVSICNRGESIMGFYLEEGIVKNVFLSVRGESE